MYQLQEMIQVIQHHQHHHQDHHQQILERMQQQILEKIKDDQLMIETMAEPMMVTNEQADDLNLLKILVDFNYKFKNILSLLREYF